MLKDVHILGFFGFGELNKLKPGVSGVKRE